MTTPERGGGLDTWSSRLRDRRGDAVRFLIAGATNTAIGLATYELALFLTTPSLAYALAWGIGLIFVMAVYPDRVFAGGRRRPIDRIAIALVYVTTFVLGLGVLRAMMLVTGEARLAILASLVVTTAMNFLLSRAILRRGT